MSKQKMKIVMNLIFENMASVFLCMCIIEMVLIYMTIYNSLNPLYMEIFYFPVMLYPISFIIAFLSDFIKALKEHRSFDDVIKEGVQEVEESKISIWVSRISIAFLVIFLFVM